MLQKIEKMNKKLGSPRIFSYIYRQNSDYTTTAGGTTAGGDGKVIITWYGTTHP
jgi:hypothetical protein